MPQPSRFALALVIALLATSAFAGTSHATTTALDPAAQCTPGHLPTMWDDETHPPTTVRVLRKTGPNKGHVETVGLWTYVGVVLKSEYSGNVMPAPYMHVGALTVKQYAWYYAMHWRGGKVSFTVDNGDGTFTTTTECFDLYDTTQDQLYRPEKADATNPGEWLPANQPTAVNLKAMRETWHLSMRKWQNKKNKSRIFLSGYRAGKKRPCGTDSDGFKVKQKSLKDCANKGLSLEEALREYFEPNLLLVDGRRHDIVDDHNWRGDLGLLVANGSDTQWRLYQGTADSFNAGPTGTFTGLNFSTVLGHGVAQFDPGDANGANDAKLLADLVLLMDNDKIKVARADGHGFGAVSTYDTPTGAQRLLVGDFDGDMLDDVGIMTTPEKGMATLWVMRRQVGGGFGDASSWWSGPLDVSDAAVFVAAADINGDDMADVVARDSSGNYLAAPSAASCTDLSMWGSCPASAVGTGALGELATWLAAPASVPAGATTLVGDYDRDGRDDVIAVSNGANFKVMGLRALASGGLADPLQLYQSASAFADVIPVSMDVNADGMVDVALMTKDGTGTDVHWLRTSERTANPATMSSTGGTPLSAGVNWAANPAAF